MIGKRRLDSMRYVLILNKKSPKACKRCNQFSLLYRLLIRFTFKILFIIVKKPLIPPVIFSYAYFEELMQVWQTLGLIGKIISMLDMATELCFWQDAVSKSIGAYVFFCRSLLWLLKSFCIVYPIASYALSWLHFWYLMSATMHNLKVTILMLKLWRY